MAPMILLAILAVPALARDEGSWSNLRSLRPEERIVIIQSDQKRMEGRFAGVSDSSISIRADRVVEVPKENVVRVSRRPLIGRSLRVAIGAAVGVAAGAVVNGTIGQYFRNEAHDISPAVFIGAGAGLGAGLGALSGGGYGTVYRRHP
jgi:hypothetical protein